MHPLGSSFSLFDHFMGFFSAPTLPSIHAPWMGRTHKGVTDGETAAAAEIAIAFCSHAIF